jgi:hypothetical protein
MPCVVPSLQSRLEAASINAILRRHNSIRQQGARRFAPDGPRKGAATRLGG